MTLPAFLAKIVGWLRAGYPDGVPPGDYIPLVALLGSQLTTDDLTLVLSELQFSAEPRSADEIRRAIGSVTHGEVSESDVARVRSRLAAAGWPLARPGEDGH